MWPYIIAVLAFLILVIIHEFGHFIAAKIMGVRINEFAVGFGPKLLKHKWGETTYSLNAVLLGGYCAMEGEDEQSKDERAFCNKKPWRRFIIVIMGATFNLILGLILVGFTLLPEKVFTTTKVCEFKENAVSVQSGLMVDDEIIGVNGRKIYTTYDLSYAFTNVKDGKLDIKVKRNGKEKMLYGVTFENNYDKKYKMNYLTVDFYVYGERKTVGNYIKNTFKTAFSNCAVVWRSLLDLIGGKYGISAMSGPVGLTAAVGSAAKQNLWSLLQIMALITINLGIFNLLPLPALDGGRLLFIIIEMITRKPVPQKYESLVHTVGFVLLMGFLIFITAHDIYSLFVG